VFIGELWLGNPVVVVHDALGVMSAQMAAFALDEQFCFV